MKALLLRVGIDKGCGGTLAPIFDDGSFEFVPIPESVPAPGAATYNDRIGRKGKRLSAYVPSSIKNAPKGKERGRRVARPLHDACTLHRLLDACGTIVRVCPSRPRKTSLKVMKPFRE